ncbi:hypothetical protein B484DRAFT_423373 [Ochromonadaceae sp. CCMP2298]|nr:hypothetical protein B484DRAFT_423373 [Ochromonadaceae sp. CCMP2298]
MDALSRGQLQMTPRTVELCAMFSFFLIGIIIGASLLDRLWLLGGITGAWWASGAVTRNTRGGALARRVGAQVAQYIRDLQEKYNQAIIFYQTGKMAYVSSKTWEKYDAQFQITQRASGFNSNLEEAGFYQQFGDVWRVIVTAPREAQKLDSRFQVTTSVGNFARGVVGGAGGLLGGVAEYGAQLPPLLRTIEMITGALDSLIPTGPAPKRRVNPWGSPFNTYKATANGSTRRGVSMLGDVDWALMGQRLLSLMLLLLLLEGGKWVAGGVLGVLVRSGRQYAR